MREMTFEEVRDTVVGASVLGCGGGGELAEGLELIPPFQRPPPGL